MKLNSFNERFLIRFIESIVLIATLSTGLYLFINNFHFAEMFDSLLALNIYDMYFTQVSVSFIIISLVSVLTNTSKPVYWVDISQYKLIEPQHTSFIDFSAYILGGLAISTLFMLLCSNYILLSFIISVIFMMALTIKMIGAYFGREAVKLELQNNYKKLNEKYENDLHSLFSYSSYDDGYTESERTRRIEAYMKSKEDYLLLGDELEYTTYQEIDNKEFKLVRENLELLAMNDDFNRIVDIFRYISENMVGIYCKFARQFVKRFMNCESKTINYNHKDRFFQLAYNQLIKSIDGNDLQEVSISLYTVILTGRNGELSEESLDKRELPSKKYYMRIVLMLSNIYQKCINENKFDLLNAFLHAYDQEIGTFRSMLFKMSEQKSSNIDKLYDSYKSKLGLDIIVQKLIDKVNSNQIEYDQINMVIKSLIQLYIKVYSMIDTIGIYKSNPERIKNEDIIDTNMVELLLVTYQKGLLDKKTYSILAHRYPEKWDSIYFRIINTN